jgi:hypothetical protein
MPYFLQRSAHEHIQKIWHRNLFFSAGIKPVILSVASARKQPQVFHGNIF